MIVGNKELVYLVVACAFALTAAYTDLDKRKIPNWLTGSAFLSGLALHAALDGWHGALSNTPYLLIFTARAGGALGIYLALRHGRLKETITNVGVLASHHARHGVAHHQNLNIKNGATLRLPYAVPMALGSLLTLYLREIAK